MRPLVSILIPAYNAERWIAETIRSALAQTWQEREIIVVDDGSKDQTLAAARRFTDRGVVVVSQTNQGASAARNTALQHYRGEYIQWLDADDLLAADKIEKQLAAAEVSSKRTLLSSAWGHFLWRVEKAEFIPSALWQDLSPVEWLIRKMGQNLQMQTATWLISRELTQAAGAWDVRLWKDNDGEYLARVILASDGIRFVPGARTFYRRSGAGSVTHIGRSSKKLESQFLSMQLHVKYLRSLEESERTRAACLSYLQRRFPGYYPQRPDLVAKLQQLAADLGGQLHVPKLSWKYAWIRKVFGWGLAKEAQLIARRAKEDLLRCWDRTLFYLENKARP